MKVYKTLEDDVADMRECEVQALRDERRKLLARIEALEAELEKLRD